MYSSNKYRGKQVTQPILLCLLFISPLMLYAQAGRNVELLGQLDYTQAVSDVWGYADGNGNEYALVGVVDGTSIVDVTDPANPTEVAFIPGPPAPPFAWRDIKTHSHYAYIVTEGPGAGAGMQVVDMSDPPNATVVFTFDSTFTTAHNLYVVDGFAYVVGTSGAVTGFHILDLSNPEHPVEVGSYAQPYVHDIYVRNDTAFASAIYDGNLEILDVSDKSHIVRLGSFHSPSGAVHNSWTTEDGQYLLTTDEIAGGHLLIWDIRNLQNVELVGSYESGNGISIHNVFIKGNYAHISYYVDGYRIVDISDPADPVEVGFYDTFPSSTPALFEGDWGVYPYAPSGNIYVSDIESGLFVLRVTEGVVPGRIDGLVVDQDSGSPIAGAEVRLVEASKYLQTDAGGAFAINIFDGHHTVVTSANGYFPDTTEIDLAPGGQQTLAINLVASGITAGWLPQTSQGLNSDHYIYSIAAVDKNIVWAVATTNNASNRRPRFLRTTDSGNSWTVGFVTGLTDESILDIAAIDANTAWVTTNFGSRNGIYKTTDGGATWTMQLAAPTVFIHFFDDQNGVQINRQLMHTTANGGATWSQVPSGNIPAFGSDEFTILFSSTNNYHAQVGDTIWFGTSRGRVYRSTNRGRSWTARLTSLGQNRALHSLAFEDANNGVAASAFEFVSGNYLSAENQLSRTVDGGETWYTIAAPVTPAALSLAYVPGSAGNYVLVSQPGSAYSTGGRFDWTEMSAPLALRAVAFAAPNVGWAGSYGGGFTHLYKFSGTALTNEGAQISVNPPIIDFGLLGIGDSSSATITIKSAGTEGLTVSAITGFTAHFRLSGLPTLPTFIPPGNTESFEITFLPSGTGDVSGLLTIISDDLQDATVNITLYGEGLPAASLSGVVKDSLSGDPIMSTIEFLRQGEATPRAVVATNRDGSYNATIVVGTYDIHVSPDFPYPESLHDDVEHSANGTKLDFLIKPPRMALVDDDSSGVASQLIGAMLGQLGFEYGVWNVRTQGGNIPADKLNLMAEPRILIWLTGEVSADVLTSEERATIIGHLDHGNSLILSGENIAETASPADTLMVNYLGVEFVANSSAIPVEGFAGDPIGGGLSMRVTGASKDQLQIVSSPNNLISKAFHYASTASDTTKLAAIRAQSKAGWKAVYAGFGLEKIGIGRRTFVERTIQWLTEAPPVKVDDQQTANLPRTFGLQQNYPNPFNPTTIIRYELPRIAEVELKIFDLQGRAVKTLVQASMPAGFHSVQWDGKDGAGRSVAAGVYLYRLTAGNFTMTRRLVLMK